MTDKILILGGTAEARQLADALDVKQQYEVLTSLAGRTGKPLLASGATRIGGFGGPNMLTTYIEKNDFSLLIDATHPHAARISANAATASAVSGVTCFRLERPAWQPEKPGQWIPAPDAETAAKSLPKGAKVLLTIGHQDIGPFVQRLDITVLARMIERPEVNLLAPHRIMLARPPFPLEDEKLLMRTEHISHLVTKNAGGSATAAKLEAAACLNIPITMIERPELPEMETVRSVEQALSLIDRLLAQRPSERTK